MALYILSNAYRKPVECVIRVGTARRLINAPFAFIKQVTVDCRRDRATVATLQLMARRESDRRGAVQEAGMFGLGEPIIIAADFGGHLEEVIRGFVREINANYGQDSSRPSQVTVVCQDESLRLDRKPVSRTWGGDTPTNDRSIAAAILEKYGLTLDPDSGTGFNYPVLHQDDTDLRFLQVRAGANGYELLFRGGRVYFGPMRLDAKPQAGIQVHQGAAAHCRSFALQSSRRRHAALSFQQARGELNSPHYGRVLRVGEPVGVNGIGASYDGIYYVDTVSHRFTPAGYRQRFTLLRSTAGDELDDIIVRHPERVSPLYKVL